MNQHVYFKGNHEKLVFNDCDFEITGDYVELFRNEDAERVGWIPICNILAIVSAELVKKP